jgi:RNA polymerase sigma-70 factor (ECF subfamily)
VTAGADANAVDRRRDFERLALPVAPALYRTAVRLGQGPDDARDVVQETFLRAYRTFDNFQSGTNGKAWLFTIMHSILSNRRRAERRAPDELAMDDADAHPGMELAGNLPDAEHLLLQRLDASAEVDAALRDLPEPQRAVILLVDVEELTYEEAAAALACPVGTVRSRLARGRRHLYLALAGYARRIGVLRGPEA